MTDVNIIGNDFQALTRKYKDMGDGSYAEVVYSTGGSSTGISARLLTEQFVEQTRAFLEWCNANSATPYIGEIGWPSEKLKPGQGAGWNSLGESFYNMIDSYNAHATYFSANKMRVGDNIRAYSSSTVTVLNTPGGTLDTKESQASVVEAHPGSATIWRGVNMFDPATKGANVRVNGAATTFYFGNAGILNTDYEYPTQADFQYLYNQGHRLFRIPVFLERLLTAASSVLVASELTAINAAVAACVAVGGKVILDCHNFGQVGISSLVVQIAGGGGYAQSDLVDFWTKMSTAFKANAGVLGYGIMNEPWAGASYGLYTLYVQACIAAIRANADTKVISVPTINFQLPGSPANPYTDSASNLWHEMHFYADQTGGNYVQSLAGLEAQVKAQVSSADGRTGTFSTVSHVVEETVSRLIGGSSTTLVSGTLYLSYFTAVGTVARTNIYTRTRATGSAGLTLARIGLYLVNADDSLVLLQGTVSDTTLWNSTFAAYNKAITSTPLVAGQRYAIGVLAVGTTMPILNGAVGGVDLDMTPRLTAQIAAQADLPSTLATGALAATANGLIYSRVT